MKYILKHLKLILLYSFFFIISSFLSNNFSLADITESSLQILPSTGLPKVNCGDLGKDACSPLPCVLDQTTGEVGHCVLSDGCQCAKNQKLAPDTCTLITEAEKCTEDCLYTNVAQNKVEQSKCKWLPVSDPDTPPCFCPPPEPTEIPPVGPVPTADSCKNLDQNQCLNTVKCLWGPDKEPGSCKWIKLFDPPSCECFPDRAPPQSSSSSGVPVIVDACKGKDKNQCSQTKCETYMKDLNIVLPGNCQWDEFDTDNPDKCFCVAEDCGNGRLDRGEECECTIGSRRCQGPGSSRCINCHWENDI